MRIIAIVLAMCLAPNAWADFAKMQAQLDALQAKAVPVSKPAEPKYNIYRSGSNWTYPVQGNRRESLIRHLMGELGAKKHAEKFDRRELEKLSLKQLEALHSNDHEGRPYVQVKSRKKSKPPS